MRDCSDPDDPRHWAGQVVLTRGGVYHCIEEIPLMNSCAVDIEYRKGIKLLIFGCINIIYTLPHLTQTMRNKCLKHVLLPQNEETCHHRRRVKTEEKAKVVASVWGDSYFAWDDFEE